MSFLVYVPILFLIHSGYSLMKWRKFLAAENNQSFFIPSDILVEAVVSFVSALILCILSFRQKYKPVRDAPSTYTYDSLYSHANFRNLRQSRAVALREITLKKLSGLNIR